MREKGKVALPGLGMMGAAGVAALLAGGALTAFIVLVLSLFLDDWLAALLTGVGLAGVAAALALAGKERVEEMGTPLPEQTIETIKEDAAWMKEQAKSGRESRRPAPGWARKWRPSPTRPMSELVSTTTSTRRKSGDLEGQGSDPRRRLGRRNRRAEQAAPPFSEGHGQRNPLGLVVGGAAIGFVAGLLLPSTRVEDEQIGEMATKLKDTAKETGQEALDRGKVVAQSAMETAKEEGSQQGRELTADLKERVQPETEGEHVAW